MQYRWIAELREAERRQFELSLKSTADHFAEDFVSELLRVVTAFQLEYRSRSELLSDQLKDAYEQWVGSAPHPGLIQQLLIVRPAETEPRAYRFEPTSGALRAMPWLDLLDPLKDLNSYSQVSSASKTGSYPKNPIFLEAIPAMAIPFVVTENPIAVASRRAIPQERKDVMGWSVAVLDRNLIVEELLPGLFASHFAVGDPPPYRVVIAATDKPERIIYQSESMSDDDLSSADLVLDLFKKVGGQLKIGGPQTVRIDAPDTPQWRLFVKHRMGSLDAAVEDVRRRNLAVGAGILLVLAASAALVLVLAGRARTLARIQVEFAAAVSHELRTPLAVIRAAAYNLEEGVVEDRSQVRHYAGVVQDAGRRLSKMVDQILLFADTQSWRRRMTFTAINVSDVVEKALEGVSAVLPTGGSVEKVLPPDLPQILADPVLLGHCIENLVINAVKYGEASDSKPVTISAHVDRESGKVQIRVADRGPGIDPIDLPHIFKPFYRGKNADLDLKGTGLGLALVQRLMQCQRGDVSVRSAPRHGSTFTIYIPIAA